MWNSIVMSFTVQAPHPRNREPLAWRRALLHNRKIPRQVHIMLTAQQLDEFRRSGILYLPGVISVRAAAAMCDRVWEMMTRRYQIRRDDPATWKARRIAGTKNVRKR
jgi:hypothetical protein